MGRAERGEDTAFGGGTVHGASPAGTDIDIVDVSGAVGVRLGPFTADGWAPAVETEKESRLALVL